METLVTKDELYSLIKSAVREVLQEEMFENFFMNIKDITDEEMEDIESIYGKPSLDKAVEFSETVEI